MYTYEDLIEAINSNHENDHEKLIYIIYTLGRYLNMNVDNWITSLDKERERENKELKVGYKMTTEKYWVEITYCDYETQEDLQTLGESEMFDNEQDALDRFEQDINLIVLGGEFGGVWMGDIAVHVNIMCDEETINPNGTLFSWYGMDYLDGYYNNGRE